jgi:predicted short-subunit dehydrogenase-like oxidoreductase (DUF2520 family)
LAVELKRAGYRVREIVSRSGAGSLRRARALARRVQASAVEIGEELDGEIVWLCVPDVAVASTARALAARGDWSEKIALHPSGALGSTELKPLREAGASVAAAHPLMTFVSRSKANLKGVPFGVEGDPRAVRAAKRIVRDLGAQVFPVDSRLKSAYHAWGAYSSPLLIALLVTAEQVARTAGVPPHAARRRMLPILEQTLRNYAALGPSSAFSGPLVRGDAETIAAHLSALKAIPEERAVYIALARSALKHLPVKNRERIAKLLRRP